MMGKYDNYFNEKGIKHAQKRIDSLSAKRHPDLYKIGLVKRELDTAKLFETCQIFGSANCWKKRQSDPNTGIMFSDDNRVLLFGDKLIYYEDIKSCQFIDNKVQKSYTTTKKKGTVSRAIVGGILAGGIGAVLGAISADEEANTTFYEVVDGFLFQIFLRDGNMYQYPVLGSGIISRKVSRAWMELAQKIQMIIEGNN